MSRFILRRLLQAIPTLFGITLISYGIMLAAPGGPVAALTFSPRFSPQERAAVAERLGVNDPFHVQYLRWLIGDDWMTFCETDRDGVETCERGERKGILRGDFGVSFTANRSALEVIVEKIPATLELAVIAFIIGLTGGLLIGTLAAVNQGGWFDQITRVLTVLFSAIPTFWLGLVLLLIFGTWLGWLPMGNRYPLTLMGDYTLLDRLKHLVLPVFVLATGDLTLYSRFMRASVLDALSQDYIRTARAKGLASRTVWFRHALRNALVPIATIVGPAIPGLIGGSLIVEQIFSWPGVGRLAFTAVGQQDYPVVMAAVLIGGITTIIGYLLADVFVALVDPRIRLS
ncbi:MAG: ABC transporter permease [bacterium]|nr:ABC transporter permease [bacterium]